MASGKLIRLDVDGKKTETITIDWNPTMEELQKAVGGYVNSLVINYEGIRRQAYVDEEGGFGPGCKGLPVNEEATRLWHAANPLQVGRNVIRGPMAIWIPDEVRRRKDR